MACEKVIHKHILNIRYFLEFLKLHFPDPKTKRCSCATWLWYRKQHQCLKRWVCSDPMTWF